MATKGITIDKPPFMSDNEWHYFKLASREAILGKNLQWSYALIFHNGWEACAHDDHRRSAGEELPNE